MRVFVILLSFVGLGCQSIGSKNSSYSQKGINGETSVLLRFQPELNRQDRVKYYSYSDTKTFEDGDIRHQRQQVVTFELAQVVKKTDVKTGRYTLLESTIKKDGLINLNLFGLPDLGEAFDREYTNRGFILSAGSFPKDSFYLVPYLTLPKGKVSVGDTWTMSKSWKTGSTPFSVNAVFILKGFVDCGPGDRCADIEISADVIPELENKDTIYQVVHQGRVLVALKRSSVIWGTFKAREQLSLKKSVQKISSCITFHLDSPSEYTWDGVKSECDPGDPNVLNLKGLPTFKSND